MLFIQEHCRLPSQTQHRDTHLFDFQIASLSPQQVFSLMVTQRKKRAKMKAEKWNM